MEEKVVYSSVHWAQYELETGKLIQEGTQDLSVKANRIRGPGVNNALIYRLKKGETVSIDIPAMGMKAVFTPQRQIGK